LHHPSQGVVGEAGSAVLSIGHRGEKPPVGVAVARNA
jgi:hypothetical protein